MNDFRAQRDRLVPIDAIDHHIADLTFTAGANVSLAALQTKLGEQDQWLPIDGDPSRSLRDLIEMNSTGPMRCGFGAWRDLLLGCQFTTKSNQLITAGGRAMKNVAGYDLTKFLVGSFGRFGKLETITARTWKRPAGALHVSFNPDQSLAGKLLPTSARPAWMMRLRDRIICCYFGDAAAIEFFESTTRLFTPVAQARHSLDEDVQFRAAHWLPRREGVEFRASIPPNRIEQFFSQIETRELAGDCVFGIVVGSIADDSQRSQIADVVASMDGTVRFDDVVDEAIRDETTRRLLVRLESAFA